MNRDSDIVYDYTDYCSDKRKKRETGDVKKIWNSIDSNQDNSISFAEAIIFANKTMMFENGNKEDFFGWATKQWGILDKNKDGSVTPQEFKKYLG